MSVDETQMKPRSAGNARNTDDVDEMHGRRPDLERDEWRNGESSDHLCDPVENAESNQLIGY